MKNVRFGNRKPLTRLTLFWNREAICPCRTVWTNSLAAWCGDTSSTQLMNLYSFCEKNMTLRLRHMEASGLCLRSANRELRTLHCSKYRAPVCTGNVCEHPVYSSALFSLLEVLFVPDKLFPLNIPWSLNSNVCEHSSRSIDPRRVWGERGERFSRCRESGDGTREPSPRAQTSVGPHKSFPRFIDRKLGTSTGVTAAIISSYKLVRSVSHDSRPSLSLAPRHSLFLSLSPFLLSLRVSRVWPVGKSAIRLATRNKRRGCGVS